MKKLFGTLAMAAAAALAAGGAARAANVSIFTNTTYVDYIPGDSNAEASNVLDSVALYGHSIGTFSGISQASIERVSSGRDALIIPELEKFPTTSLFAALSTTARAEIIDYVESGGALVFFIASSRSLELVNGLFGWSLASGGGCPCTLSGSAAAGTPFQGGPGSIPFNNATNALSIASLPAGSRAIYTSGANAGVAMMPQGGGYVVFLGWDWFDALPTGTQDGGWLDVLNAAINVGADPTKADVALLANDTYVNYNRGDSGAEASNTMASLQNQGSKVMPFTGITPAALSGVLANRDALAIPEQESGDLFPALSAGARDTVVDFVETGGNLVVFNSGTTPSNTLVNGLFGFSIASLSASGPYGLDNGEAAGTPFAGGPASLNGPSATAEVDWASLPPGARAIYRTGNSVVVASIPYGCGTVTLLGWDWFNAHPIGVVDGWNEVANRALGQERRMLVDKDFNGDGQTDTLWRNTVNGAAAIWLMEDTERLAGALLGTIPLVWEIAGTGDFNRDCKSDIVWRNLSTGNTLVWQMSGFTRETMVSIGAPPTVWEIEEVFDTDGDGFADIFWRQSANGDTAVWEMNGYAISAVGFPGPVPAAWEVE